MGGKITALKGYLIRNIYDLLLFIVSLTFYCVFRNIAICRDPICILIFLLFSHTYKQKLIDNKMLVCTDYGRPMKLFSSEIPLLGLGRQFGRINSGVFLAILGL